ncbi:hypothetical protein [Streptomyces silvisoli]|uniref:Uncharacterized protein n=1 Tax=Streptomyces silvisoli TaxID=3034235 RepID=A0ABT5ZQL0_9ACTN|nr:hypothetical protein [Streptomyces silvisoli]MDF3292001.1 hypothetical protein [Streptomyces silvisoli]
MASRASSEMLAIPKLPGLGTTWYGRGARYWVRRITTAVVWLAMVAFFCFIAISLYRSFRTDLPPTVRMIWDWAQVAASCVAVVWGWAVQRADLRRQLLDPPSPGEIRARKRDEQRRAPGLIALGRAVMLFAAPVMPAFAAWVLGWTCAMVTVREYPSEVGARRALEKRVPVRR